MLTLETAYAKPTRSLGRMPLATPASQIDETDPAPYKPSPDDHISLNQKTCPDDSCRPRVRVKAHSESRTPKQIRLKAASTNAAPEAWTTGLAVKSTAAGAALTQTFVHNHRPGQEQQPSERRSSTTSDTGRRRSATLQVVRSRDSVYEVIWEDITAVGDSSSTSGSSSPTSPNEPATASPTRGVFATTSLVAWSWEGELVPYPSSKHLENVTSAGPKPRRSSMKKRECSGDASRSQTLISDIPVTATVISEPDSLDTTTSQDSSRALLSFDQPTQRLGSQLRHSLLCGGRKPSNPGPEEDHFASHRDSLVLAHKRIAHEKKA